MGGSNPWWKIPPLGRWSWLYWKGQTEQALTSKPVSCIPQHHLPLILPAGPASVLSVINHNVEVWAEQNLPPQVAFAQNVFFIITESKLKQSIEWTMTNSFCCFNLKIWFFSFEFLNITFLFYTFSSCLLQKNKSKWKKIGLVFIFVHIGSFIYKYVDLTKLWYMHIEYNLWSSNMSCESLHGNKYLPFDNLIFSSYIAFHWVDILNLFWIL